MWESVGPNLPWIAVAAVVIALGYFRHLEKLRRLDNLHRERLKAIEKGLSASMSPVGSAAAFSRRPQPRLKASLVTGLILCANSLGVMAILFVNLPEAAHNFWIVPLPILVVGVGLILFYLLKDDGFNRFH